MQHRPVASSAITSIGYDPTTQTLEVAFKSGETYRYDNVSALEHAGLVDAPSIGQRFAEEFRNREHVRIPRDDEGAD